MRKKRSIYAAGLLAFTVILAGCSDEPAAEVKNLGNSSFKSEETKVKIEDVTGDSDVTTVNSSLPEKDRIKAEVQYEKEINNEGETVITDEEIEKIMNSSGNSFSSNGDVNESNEVININQCINLNTASLEDLEEIKHIGKEKAQEVIDKREYEKVEDLTIIDGIGPERIQAILSEDKACVS